jgi:hypothetical protein
LPICRCAAQFACATAIIVITALKLHKVNITFDQNTWNTDVLNVCLLGNMSNGANLCYFAYAAGGISVLATMALSILQCCTCNLCGLGGILDAAFAAAGTVVWAAAGVIFDQYYKLQQQTNPNVPRPEWRLSITIISFVACALFGIMALAAVYSILSACCCGRCCGGGGGSRDKVVYRDVEKGRGQFMVR